MTKPQSENRENLNNISYNVGLGLGIVHFRNLQISVSIRLTLLEVEAAGMWKPTDN